MQNGARMRNWTRIAALVLAGPLLGACGVEPSADTDAGVTAPDATSPDHDGGALEVDGGDEPDAGPGGCGALLCPVDPRREPVGYNGIWGAADDAIWIVGARGQIRFFDGTRWTPQESGTEWDLSAVHGTARDDVWAVGDSGTLLHFDGASWALVEHGTTTGPLVDVVAVSRDEVWAVGGERLGAPIVLHWDGSTWATDDGPPSTRSMLAIDATATRVVALDHERAWQRSAGAWTELARVFEPFDIAIAGDTVLVLKRDFGDVMADDGSSTTPDLEFFSEATHDPYRFAASALDRVVVVGERGRIHERDGAEDRHRERTQHTLRAAWIASDGTAWAVGDAGTLVRIEPERMRTIDAGDQRTMLAVHARASDDVWTAGLAGNVLHFDGAGWTLLPSGVDVDLRAIVAAADGSTWVAGEDGVAVRFVGTTPERHDLGVDADIRALVADGGAAVWAAGTVLHRWDGSAWAEVGPLAYPALDAWSPGAGDIWLAEELGHAQRFVDGVEQPGIDLGGGEEATAIWGTGPSDVWIARRGPSLMHWTGSAWEGVETPSVGLDSWASIFGTSADDVIAVGRTAVRYDGTEWMPVNAGGEYVDIHGVGSERWAVGWDQRLWYGVLD